MAKTKLQGLKRATALETLKRSLPAARSKRTGKGSGSGLKVTVPPKTQQALRVRAAQDGTTVQALVLEALRKAGFPVPANEIVDRRRTHRVVPGFVAQTGGGVPTNELVDRRRK